MLVGDMYAMLNAFNRTQHSSVIGKGGDSSLAGTPVLGGGSDCEGRPEGSIVGEL